MTVSFDRVADLYDATRGFPEGVAERVAEAIADEVGATAETELLEVGVGTGRIALPLLKRGLRVAGVDVSAKMLDELRAKLREPSPRLRLELGDATALPFPDGGFDAALTVHVLHLIPAWRAALAELRRVLQPGGVYLHCYEEYEPDAALRVFLERWDAILEGYGVRTPPYGAGNREVLGEIERQGAQLETRAVAEWRGEIALGALLELYERRAFSRLWRVPDAVYPRAVADLRAWALARYGSEDAPLVRVSRFVIVAARHWASV